MNQVLNANGFVELDEREAMNVDGGMAPAWLYALGFVASTTPLNVCIGAGLVVVGTAAWIYGASRH